MNTRGLMELVVLNIGFDLGVLTSEMFHDDGDYGIGHDFYDRPGSGYDQL